MSSAMDRKERREAGGAVSGREPRAVIFDMDGLLFDTERIAVDSWKEACGRLGFDADGDILLSTVGCDLKRTGEILVEHYGADFDFEAASALRHAIADKHIAENGVPLKAGVRRILSLLEERQIPLAVATSTPTPAAEALLEKAGIRRYFTAVLGGDSAERNKPAPDIYRMAAARIGTAPENCLVFEDSANGLKAAAAAGTLAVHIPDLVEHPEAVLRLARFIYPSLDAAADELDRLLASGRR